MNGVINLLVMLTTYMYLHTCTISRMTFLPPNQQCQSTEGHCKVVHNQCFSKYADF